MQIQRYLAVTLRMAFKKVRVLQWPYLNKHFNLYSALPALLRSKNVTLSPDKSQSLGTDLTICAAG